MQFYVYTQPGCNPCQATKRYLDKKGVPYETIDVTETPGASDMLVREGHKATPVVKVSDEDGVIDSWAGFDINRLKGWTEAYHAG